MLDMASEELRLPMTALEESKKSVLRQTLKDYGLLTSERFCDFSGLMNFLVDPQIGRDHFADGMIFLYIIPGLVG